MKVTGATTKTAVVHQGLRALVDQAARLLDHDGRLVMISYHSLEDRIVKNAFRDLSRCRPIRRPGTHPAFPASSVVAPTYHRSGQ